MLPNVCFFSFFIIFNLFSMEDNSTDFTWLDNNFFDMEIEANFLGNRLTLPNEITNENDALIYLIGMKNKIINEEKELSPLLELSDENKNNSNERCNDIISNIMEQRFNWSQCKINALHDNEKKILEDLYSKKTSLSEFIAEFDVGKLNPLMVAAANDSKNAFIKLLHIYNHYLKQINQSLDGIEFLSRVNIDGYDVRIFAAILNSKKVMSVLLGLNLNMLKDSIVLYCAIRYDSVDIFNQIHEKYPVDACYMLNLKNHFNLNIVSVSEIHLAAYYGSCKIINYLLNRQVSPNFWLDNHDVPLHFAASNNQKEAVELLISRGADVNSSNHTNLTPLMAASFKGFVDIAQILINNNANLNDKTVNGHTALMFAAGNFIKLDGGIIKDSIEFNSRRKQTSELLMKNGAFTDLQDNDGLTCLMHAINDRNHDMIASLFVCSKLNIKNNFDQNALEMFNNYLDVSN